MKNIPLFLFLMLLMTACKSDKQSYHLSSDTPAYEAYDLTEENVFSKNIEGPAFRNDTLFVVNYQHDGTIGMVLPDGQVELYKDLPEGTTANSIKFDTDGNMLLADFTGHNILKVDPVDKKVSVYLHNPDFNQPNDIIINSRDWLYASDPDWDKETGKVWLIKDKGQAELVADSIGTANGIALSPDEKYLFVNESVQRKVWRYTVNDDGTLSDKQLFTSFPDYGLDGMHFGKDGNLYICRYGKGTIAVFNLQGKQLHEIQLKGEDCSNFTFGDPDGKTAFVTLQDRKAMEMFRIE